MRRLIPPAALVFALLIPSVGLADDGPTFDRKMDAVYGRKVGTALTMDVFTPKKGANGAAVVLVVSGGYFSSHEAINPSSSCRSSTGATRSSPSSTAANPVTRCPRSSST